MPGEVYVATTLKGLAKQMRTVSDSIRAVTRGLNEEVAIEFGTFAPQISPVGSPARGDKHPGKYRASLTLGIGAPDFVVLPDAPSYPIPGAPQVEAILRDWNGTAPLFFANAAADEARPDSSYAGVLEGGWSPQATDGIFGPTIEHINGMSATLSERAVERGLEVLRAGAVA
jgi:hypothetical protein